MGFEDIGLEAIFKNANFLAGMREYRDALGLGKSDTEGAGKSMTRALSDVGGTAVLFALAAVSAAIGTVAGAALAAIPAVLGWSSAVDSIGDVLGTTSEDSSALAVAIRLVGGNVEAITGQMAFLTRGLEDVDGKIGPTGKVLKEMGIAFRDANGEILPATDILTAVADQLAGMPDGLAKTTLMTRLFGKSGKDLTDTLNALTTEGFAKADAMAKELGLSMGDDTVGGAIELQKQFEFVKMAGQGLMVQLGRELMPAVSDLAKEAIGLARKALPKVREMLPQIAAAIKTLAGVILKAVPAAFEALKSGFDWLAANKHIVIGALAAIAVAVAVWAYTTIAAAIPAIVAMVTAAAPLIAVLLVVAAVVAALAWAWENNFMGMRDALTAFWVNTVQPLLGELWDWLAVNVPAAIEILRGFWENTLLPAIQAVWSWIQSNVFPLFQTLWDWLAVNVPAAIEILRGFWEDTLLPALQAVWTWMSTVLFPFLESVANFISAVFGLAVRTLSDVWRTNLLPALQEVWGFINDNVFPLFERFTNWLTETFGPVIEKAAAVVKDVLGSAFEWATSRLMALTDWLNNLAAKIGLYNSGGGGGGGGWGTTTTCFTGETAVNVPGGVAAIQDLKSGDAVLLLTDEGLVAALVAHTIHSRRDDLVKVTLEDGRVFRCSPNHRFKTSLGWVEAARLIPGDELVANGGPAWVRDVRAFPGVHEIYNIEVDHPDHTYLVNGVVVHNAKPAGSYGGRGSMGRTITAPATPAATRSTTINNSYSFGGNNISSGLDWAVLEARIEQIVARSAG